MEDTPPSPQQSDPDIIVRPATIDDHDAVAQLVRNDSTGAAIEPAPNFAIAQSADQEDPDAARFWVAQSKGGEVIGMIGLRRPHEHVGEMRRLLVRGDKRQKGVGRLLVEEALRYCNDRGYVKVVLKADVEQQPAIALFKRFGFQLNRTRQVQGREHMEFYMDLYRQPTDEPG